MSLSNKLDTRALVLSALMALAGIINMESVWAINSLGTCPKDMMGNMDRNLPNHEISKIDFDSSRVRELADAECANCHGVQGISHSRDVPNLAGQNPLYLCEWLDACRKEGGQCESHEDIAGALTDKDIVGLSEFYSMMPGFGQ